MPRLSVKHSPTYQRRCLEIHQADFPSNYYTICLLHHQISLPGGYETLALFRKPDGQFDFEAAYDAQLPDSDDEDGYRLMEPFERAMAYKIKQETRKYERQNRQEKVGRYGHNQRETIQLPSASH